MGRGHGHGTWPWLQRDGALALGEALALLLAPLQRGVALRREEKLVQPVKLVLVRR